MIWLLQSDILDEIFHDSVFAVFHDLFSLLKLLYWTCFAFFSFFFINIGVVYWLQNLITYNFLNFFSSHLNFRPYHEQSTHKGFFSRYRGSPQKAPVTKGRQKFSTVKVLAAAAAAIKTQKTRFETLYTQISWRSRTFRDCLSRT